MSRQKIVSRQELSRLTASIQADNKGKVVLTNGCFDLLHVGHVRYLSEARCLGTALAVGINSDASVRRLKGPGRPLTPEDERAEILAALENVDFVTVFDEDTAAELAGAVRPAVYAKGGDYSSDPQTANFPPEARVVTASGGTFRVLSYVPDHSTTSLLTVLRRHRPPQDLE